VKGGDDAETRDYPVCERSHGETVNRKPGCNPAAAEEFGAEIKTITKTSQEYGQIKDPLPCSSVVVNGKIITRDDSANQQELKKALMSYSEVLTTEGKGRAELSGQYPERRQACKKRL